MRILRPISSVLAGLSLFLATSGLTSANSFGSSFQHICDNTPASQCKSDNASHGVIISVTGDYATQVRGAIQHYDSVVPPISMFEVIPPPGPAGYKVEVLFTTRPDVQAFAWGQCAGPPGSPGVTYGGSDAQHTRWCKPQRFYYNLAFASAFSTSNKKRYIACHELGHTLGLRHNSAPSCMQNAQFNPPVLPTSTTTTTHDRDHIDAAY